MVFNVTFNNISAISWWSVLMVEETGGLGEKHLDIVKRLVSQNYSKVFRGKKINQDIQNRPMKE
jgi:hypothetical protein